MTSEAKTRKPAFPVSFGPDGTPGYDDGMTLRDYFAGQALVGLVASKLHTLAFQPKDDASYCYALADAMLKERER